MPVKLKLIRIIAYIPHSYNRILCKNFIENVSAFQRTGIKPFE